MCHVTFPGSLFCRKCELMACWSAWSYLIVANSWTSPSVNSRITPLWLFFLQASMASYHTLTWFDIMKIEYHNWMQSSFWWCIFYFIQLLWCKGIKSLPIWRITGWLVKPVAHARPNSAEFWLKAFSLWSLFIFPSRHGLCNSPTGVWNIWSLNFRRSASSNVTFTTLLNVSTGSIMTTFHVIWNMADYLCVKQAPFVTGYVRLNLSADHESECRFVTHMRTHCDLKDAKPPSHSHKFLFRPSPLLTFLLPWPLYNRSIEVEKAIASVWKTFSCRFSNLNMKLC